MIIVSGRITLRSGKHDEFLSLSRPAIEAARKAPGCHWFAVSADQLEPDLVNVYEEWASEEELTAFRQDGPSSDLSNLIAAADVKRHVVSHSGPA
jgi:quinol monooxygenase YgiN